MIIIFRYFICALTIIPLMRECCRAQGINNLWLIGYSENYSDFGGSDINFLYNQPDTSRVYREMNIGFNISTICDSSGQLLFYSNGYDVADRNGQIMPNGHGLHGSDNLTGWAQQGGRIPQGSLILPDPGNPDHYYLYHEKEEMYAPLPGGGASLFPTDLYCSEVDMSLNGGLGDVINKNTVVLNDTLVQGQIAACKHANGRDWWLIIPEFGHPSFYRYLLTPYGLQFMGSQQIGIHQEFSGQSAFSPDGSYYAYYNWYFGMEVFNFDRCSGLFSNPQHLSNIDTMETGWGLAFSPDSRKIYIASGIFIHQLDLNAPTLAGSDQIIAIWDGYFDQARLATIFGFLQLAPDGKIYISTGNSTHFLHSIENPDVLGVGCNLVQRAVTVPTWYNNSIPNHPNYFLGPVNGSVCDTITNIKRTKIRNNVMSVFPNPAISGNMISVQYPTLNSFGGKIQLLGINGKLLSEEDLPPWSQVRKIKLPEKTEGLFVLRLLSNEYQTVSRILVVKE